MTRDRGHMLALSIGLTLLLVCWFAAWTAGLLTLIRLL